MKGFRTPSWFRTKGRIRERQVKAQTSRPELMKSNKGKWTAIPEPRGFGEEDTIKAKVADGVHPRYRRTDNRETKVIAGLPGPTWYADSKLGKTSYYAPIVLWERVGN